VILENLTSEYCILNYIFLPEPTCTYSTTGLFFNSTEDV
jgi:hypothetical protein